MDIQEKTNVNLEEWRHSLKWYQDKINETYEDKIRECRENELIAGEGSVCQLVPLPEYDEESNLVYDYFLDTLGYSFLTVFAETYCESEHRKVDDSGDAGALLRQFNLYRIDFLKNLNLLDSLTLKLCDYNIDPSVFRYGFDTRRAREAFIWLMCTSTGAEQLDVQDINRLKTFYKVQIDRYFRRKGKYYDHNDIDKQYDSIFSELEKRRASNSYRSTVTRLLEKLKENLKSLINDTYDVYDLLSFYRNYLANADILEASKEDVEALGHAIDLSIVVRQIYLERFSAYYKMPDLQLGHSEFSGAHFSRSNIAKSNFINSNFKYAKLDNSIATECEFSICNFLSCDAKGATLDNCTFNYANMSGMDLSNASINNSLLNAVIFRDSQLDTSVGYAQDLLYEQAKLGADALNKRISELSEMGNETCDGLLKAFAYNLTRDSHVDSSSSGTSLWDLTCGRNDDYSPSLFKLGPDGQGERGVLEFQGVSEKSKDLFGKLLKICKAKIIGREFLDQLRKAETKETAEARKKRFENYGRICFEPTTLRNANIVKSMLPQIDLSHVDMRSASFERSDLSKCLAYYTEAETAYLGKANINGGEFFDSNFDNTNFSEASCIGARFINCRMHAANMNKALAIGMCIVNTERTIPFLQELLIKIDVERDPDPGLADLTENVRDDEYFNKEKMDVADSNWSEAMAAQSMFVGVKMDRSRFSATDLSNALYFNCAVRWASFERADISYGLLIGSSFHQSSFRAATLSQSHIYSCEFSGCRMKNLTFIGARVDKAIFYDNDFSETNIARGSFNNCMFRRCNFSKLNISNTVFKHCTFYGVEFKECIGVDSAQFVDCIFMDGTDVGKVDVGFDETAVPKITIGKDKMCLERTHVYIKGLEMFSNCKKLSIGRTKE